MNSKSRTEGNDLHSKNYRNGMYAEKMEQSKSKLDVERFGISYDA